jgi:selenocysteine lyase/cysteine desulfurase
MEYLRGEEQLGGYAFARYEAERIDEFYVEAARLVNCQPHNIAFACSATEAYAKALSSVPFQKGDLILTTNDDYVSNQLAFLSMEKRFGIQLIRSANLPNGDIDLADFEHLIQVHQPKLVAVTHVPTNSGLVQQVEAVGKLCRRYDCLYLLDACQSLGQMVVDVEKIGCDFMTTTGRKFLRGPRGTGFLFVSDRVLKTDMAPLFIDLRGATWTADNAYTLLPDARRFETWELSYAGLTGFTTALRYLNDIGIENIDHYNRELNTYFRTLLAGVKDLHVFDRGSELSNIITVAKEGHTQAEMEQVLKKNRVAYSITAKSSAMIDFTLKKVEWAIRLSPHYFNTKAEAEQVTEILAGM